LLGSFPGSFSFSVSPTALMNAAKHRTLKAPRE
jgi:hypothetical protein